MQNTEGKTPNDKRVYQWIHNILLGMISFALVGLFSFLWDVNSRMAVLEAYADEGGRFTQEEFNEYVLHHSKEHEREREESRRRLSKLEAAVERISPKLSGIDAKLDYVVRTVSRLMDSKENDAGY